MTMHTEFLNLHPTYASRIFFISCTHNKTKRTMKANQYETNSKENPLRNKWQPQLLTMCSHVDLNM